MKIYIQRVSTKLGADSIRLFRTFFLTSAFWLIVGQYVGTRFTVERNGLTIRSKSEAVSTKPGRW